MSVGLAPAIDLAAARSVLRPVLTRARLARAFDEARLSGAQSRKVAERLVLDGRSELRGLTTLLIEGRLTLDRWHESLRAAIESRHAAASLALIGSEVLSPADQAAIRGRLDGQLAFLRNFRDQVRSGVQPLDGTAAARAEMYADAAWSVGQEAVRDRRVRNGSVEERSILGNADHCGGCLDEAARGWQPAGTLAPIGARTCRSRCHCILEARGRDPDVVSPDTGLRGLGPDDFVPSPAARLTGQRAVLVDVARLDADWATDRNFYIPRGGVGGATITDPDADRSRYELAGEFLDRARGGKVRVEMSRLAIDASGRPRFTDGRHRFAALRDLGARYVPVTVDKADYREFARRYGVTPGG